MADDAMDDSVLAKESSSTRRRAPVLDAKGNEIESGDTVALLADDGTISGEHNGSGRVVSTYRSVSSYVDYNAYGNDSTMQPGEIVLQELEQTKSHLGIFYANPTRLLVTAKSYWFHLKSMQAAEIADLARKHQEELRTCIQVLSGMGFKPLYGGKELDDRESRLLSSGEFTFRKVTNEDI